MRTHKHVPDKDGVTDFCAKCGKTRFSAWHAVVKKPIDWKRESKEIYTQIILALINVKDAMEREDPTSLFVWTIESKIRAYTRKLERIKKEIINDSKS